jgi:hypothetical protein
MGDRSSENRIEAFKAALKKWEEETPRADPVRRLRAKRIK